MAARRTRWTRAQARRVIDDFQGSGLSVAEYARTHDIHPKRIFVWRKRFADDDGASDAPRMVELVPTAPPTQCTVRLRCPSGHVVELTNVGMNEGIRAFVSAVAEC